MAHSIQIPREPRPHAYVNNSATVSSEARPIPLAFILLAAVAVHLPLILMELPLRSYDANYHIFFAAHYARHWFDPWNTHWYAGFSQTMYPPLPHQWIALFSHVFGLNLAYLAVQFIVILLVPVGVYRYAKLWVNERAASLAALGSVFIGSLSFLVYQAGQLSTTASAALYLNAIPYLYFWIRRGSIRSLLKGLTVGAAAAAAHHITLVLGSPLFAIPVIWLAVVDGQTDAASGEGASARVVIIRAVVFAVLAMALIGIVLYPFFAAVLHNPVKQVPIFHQSRLNYLLNPEWGINYFIIPYGALILAFPWIFYYGATRRRLRPLFVGFWLTLILSLGGTTPLPKLVLGRIFEVLTYERFTLWGCIMALPFAGLAAEALIARYKRKAMIGLFSAAAVTCAMAVAWTTFHPVAAGTAFDVQPVIDFLNRENHSQFRYITLGFGEEMSRVNTYAKAETVDGDYNSARLLPELTSYGGAQLNSAKYFGTSGMNSLLAILKHADRYGLRFIFVRDRWYEPLLSFAGWRPTEEYDNGLITLWSKDDVPPAKPVIIDPKAIPTRLQGLLWGTLPIGCSFLAIILIIILPERRKTPVVFTLEKDTYAGGAYRARFSPVFGVLFVVFTFGALASGLAHSGSGNQNSPDAVTRQLMTAVQARKYEDAYNLIANKSAVTEQQFATDMSGDDNDLLNWATLQSADTEVLHQSDNDAAVRASLTWSTPVGPFHEVRDLKLVRNDGQWRVQWQSTEAKRVPPQVIPITTLQWEVIRRGPQDDWGTQDVDSPRVRVIAMNTAEYEGSAVVMGEIENEDTVPSFVSVEAMLFGDNDKLLGEESSFDKINHVLLPKAVSPFRIDFPGVSMRQVKNIRMRTGSLLISTSADPTIGITNQRITTNSTGQHVLTADLVNEGGRIINVPHVILTAYDDSGKLFWVSDAYVPHALLPQVPMPVSVALRSDAPTNVSNYRIIANYFVSRRFQ
ncbi:MAG TPA: hypothetical protein VJR04_05940 [Terriglobales bacterium]|nr:hypothetical protein [Terriglobales bacterium]